MIRLFTTILNMSIGASFCVLAVMLMRILLMRAPKVFSYLLWLIVLIRLICPVLPEAKFGLIPDAGQTYGNYEEIQYGSMPERVQTKETEPDVFSDKEPGINAAAGTDRAAVIPDNTERAMPFRVEIQDTHLMGMAVIWACVAFALISYTVISYMIFMHRIADKEVAAPFVAGLLHPVIYLPKGLEGIQEQLVRAHEEVHIERLDYLIKPAAFLVCCIHWFNPLVWVSFFLMEKDMESSCDEAVIRKIGYDRRKDYANTLLGLSESRRWKAGYPIAFGENHVKSRIKGVMKMKKAGSRIMAAGVLLVLLAAVLLLVKQPAENEVVLPEEKIAVQTFPEDFSMIPEHEADFYLYQPNEDSQELQSFSAGNQETDMNYNPGRERDQYEVLLLPQTEDAFNALGILFSLPVEGARISDTFGSRVNPVTQEIRFHLGIDFAAEEGTPITAAADGTVVKAGNDTVCGNYVVLLHENGDATYYSHCSDIMAEEGEWVARGEQIAAVGNTGNSTGPHLHFAVSRNGIYIEPEFTSESITEREKYIEETKETEEMQKILDEELERIQKEYENLQKAQEELQKQMEELKNGN